MEKISKNNVINPYRDNYGVLESTGRIQILDRFARLGDDGGSGRDVIWLIVLNAYHSSGLVQRLFGHGFQSVYYILRPGGFYRFAGMDGTA